MSLDVCTLRLFMTGVPERTSLCLADTAWTPFEHLLLGFFIL